MAFPFQIKSLSEYQQVYRHSVEEPEKFWGSIAAHFKWKKKWDKDSVLEWDFVKPDIKWFLNAKLNITENCLDRNLRMSGEQPAIIWEPNDPEEHHRVLTYNELFF